MNMTVIIKADVILFRRTNCHIWWNVDLKELLLLVHNFRKKSKYKPWHDSHENRILKFKKNTHTVCAIRTVPHIFHTTNNSQMQTASKTNADNNIKDAKRNSACTKGKEQSKKNATVCVFVTRKGVNAQCKRHGIRTRVYIWYLWQKKRQAFNVKSVVRSHFLDLFYIRLLCVFFCSRSVRQIFVYQIVNEYKITNTQSS